MSVAFVVPAFQAQASVGAVVSGLVKDWSEGPARVFVVDDGSSDQTSAQAERAGAVVLRHVRNRGKGAALRSGLCHALRLGARVAVSVDADGQHPVDAAIELARHPAPPQALVLGVRDLVAAGAPRANRFSNRFSNVFLSVFTGRWLADTQCGLRRYPIAETLALGVEANGYAFEAEVIIRAARAGWEIAQAPVTVIYPPEQQRVSHFHVVRDPARIVARVLTTVATAPGPR